MTDIPQSPTTDELVLEAREAASARSALVREIRKVYIGEEETIEVLLVALLAEGHVLLEGVPGIAKTTLVKTFARTLGCAFKRIQFTPDLLPADVTGTYVLDLKENTFVLRRGPIFGNLVLGDEINRAPAKTQSAMLEAMQERQVTIDGHTARLTPPFMVLATQNPVEHEGVYMLPEAQLDRFMFKLNLGYPSHEEERRLLRTYNQELQDVGVVLGPEDIQRFTKAATQVFIDEELMEYIVRIVTFTREHPKVLIGGSPRASLAMMNSAKVRALVHGRTYVIPDDIRFLVRRVLEHRVLLTPEAELEGTLSAHVLQQALQTVPYAAPVRGG